jgi:hypothetical protein
MIKIQCRLRTQDPSHQIKWIWSSTPAINDFVCSYLSLSRSLIKGGALLTQMVTIDATCSLESFRKFVILSTCNSFIPESYMGDYEVFPERETSPGLIYVEAADKVTLKKIRDMIFVNAKEVLGIIYSSKSGNTNLKWRQIRRNAGKVVGEASTNTLVNLTESGVITQEWVQNYLRKKAEEKKEVKTDELTN